MKSSFDISSFLEEISSLSHSIVFSILCIMHGRRSSYLFLLFSGSLHSLGVSFPLSFAFFPLFFSQLFVEPPQTTTLPSCISFSLGWFVHWLLYNLSIILQALCLPDLITWIYSSSPLYNHEGFDLGHTWMAYWFSPLSLLLAWILL